MMSKNLKGRASKSTSAHNLNLRSLSIIPSERSRKSQTISVHDQLDKVEAIRNDYSEKGGSNSKLNTGVHDPNSAGNSRSHANKLDVDDENRYSTKVKTESLD